MSDRCNNAYTRAVASLHLCSWGLYLNPLQQLDPGGGRIREFPVVMSIAPEKNRVPCKK
jgi:hypothetical protein